MYVTLKKRLMKSLKFGIVSENLFNQRLFLFFSLFQQKVFFEVQKFIRLMINIYLSRELIA